MKILVLPAPRAGADRETMERHAADEQQTILELYGRDVVRELYARANQPGRVVFVLEAASVEAAQEALATLPFARLGLIDFELIPLAPFPGLTRLAQRAEQAERAR